MSAKAVFLWGSLQLNFKHPAGSNRHSRCQCWIYSLQTVTNKKLKMASEALKVRRLTKHLN